MSITIINKIKTSSDSLELVAFIQSIQNEIKYVKEHDCSPDHSGSTITISLQNGKLEKRINACCHMYHGLIKYAISANGIADRKTNTELRE